MAAGQAQNREQCADGHTHGPADRHAHDRHGGHAHHHHDHFRAASQRALVFVLTLNSLYMFAEVLGGWLANSLALLSDAGHMFMDVAALLLSLFALRFAARPVTPEKTYGFYRLEILAALANGMTMIVLSVLVCREAWFRFQAPAPVNASVLTGIAAGGLLINVVSAWILFRSGSENLNVRGALLHVLGDLLGSVAAVVAGVLTWRPGWPWADPALSVVISLLLISGAWKLVSDAVNVLLEGAPAHLNAAAIQAEMLRVGGVRGLHDLHIWTITSGRHILTAHVVVDDLRDGGRILRELRMLLADRFGLDHSTIQLEDTSVPSVVKITRQAAGGPPRRP